jgi:hypothetical protein
MEKEDLAKHVPSALPSTSKFIQFKDNVELDSESTETAVDDVSVVMMRRAKCQHVVRYGMDPTLNIKVLLQEQHDHTRNAGSSPLDELLRVWGWVERVEEICAEADVHCDGSSVAGFYWPAHGLVDGGVSSFISSSKEETDVQLVSDTLGCVTYDSPRRQ